MKENKGIIEDWQIAYQEIPLSMATDIEDSVFNVVVGFYNGLPFKTSEIVSIKGNILETKNSEYTLGKPRHELREIW